MHDIDALPAALLAAQDALEAEYERIRGLPVEHPDVLAYKLHVLAHAKRVMQFVEAVRLMLKSSSN